MFRPQIRGSAKSLNCEKLKFGLIWFPIVLAMVTLQIISIYLALNMKKFESYWLDRLEKVQSSYGCTFDSLQIDFYAIKAEHRTTNQVIYLVVIFVNALLIITTVVQFMAH